MSPTTNSNLGKFDPGSQGDYDLPWSIYIQRNSSYSAPGSENHRYGRISPMEPICNPSTAKSQCLSSRKPTAFPRRTCCFLAFVLLGSVGNTGEDAFFIDASSLLVNAGLWYSTFEDIYISNFGGVGLHLRGPNSNFGAGNQWLLFNNLVVYRTLGGAMESGSKEPTSICTLLIAR